MGKKLVLATRKSPLALAQAGRVAAYLQGKMGAECEFLKLVTTGDRQAEWSLEEKGGKGLFTHELESALLRGEGDIAVHSAKDLPGDVVPGLATVGYLPREDPRDMLVLRSGVDSPGKVATGSPRRRRQAVLLFPNVEFVDIRGNVDTRLMKIADQNVADATVLAAAGLRRLGIESWPGVVFRPLGFESMVPAVGQGAIAIQCRAADAGLFDGIFDAATALGVGLERAIQLALGAGCQTALGAHASGTTLHLYHESIGIWVVPITKGDLAAPAAAAARILAQLGLLK
jgi:hydroxymethylbilane synthase